MQKRCTESACRRVFTVDTKAIMTSCPHCGRIYPRIPANPQDPAANPPGATYLVSIRNPGVSIEKMAEWIRIMVPNRTYQWAYFLASTRSEFARANVPLKEAVRMRRELAKAGAESEIRLYSIPRVR